jgi:hypothetical protein
MGDRGIGELMDKPDPVWECICQKIRFGHFKINKLAKVAKEIFIRLKFYNYL